MAAVNESGHWTPPELQLVPRTWYHTLLDYPLPTALLATIIVLIVTRLSSSTQSKARTQNGASIIPAHPYWLPFIGHAPQMFYGDGFLEHLRVLYRKGAFALNLGGSRHNILYTPGHVTALLNAKKENADSEDVARKLMVSIFDLPVCDLEKYDAAHKDMVECYREILSNPGLEGLVENTAGRARDYVTNLVSFLESPVDQMPWEKNANITLLADAAQGSSSNPTVVEASLFPLIRDFVAFTANPSIMGSDFLQNFPTFFDDIWTLDSGFIMLAAGLPRWAPIPTLTRAHIARRDNLKRLEEFHENLQKHHRGEPVESKWSSLDDVGTLLKARMQVYEKHDFSIRTRSSYELALMWAANANSDTLIFWMINHVYSDRVLLAQLREEIAPYIKISHERTGLPIEAPPRISAIDTTRIFDSCALLKSVYVESLRFDTAPWSFKVIKNDFVLQSREKGAEPLLLRKGEYVHAAHDLHNSDPEYWNDPKTFQADRHVKKDDAGNSTADLGTIRPYGGGASMCKGRAFALREAMLFTAIVISMWDIQPQGGGKWKMPKHKKATGTYVTSDDTRVWVSRRKF